VSAGSVLVAAATPDIYRTELYAVCRSLALEAVEHGAATVIAGCLPAGARTIPSDLVATFDRMTGSPTLVLLAEEPLVRPVVTLQEGRVVIVASSASSTHLRSVLRMVAPEEDSGSLWRSQLTAFAWTAHARPARCANEGGGVFAIVPFRSDFEFDLPDFDFAPTSSVEKGVIALANQLDRDAGVVCLAPATSEWIVYWPRVDRQAWLHSSVRLPHITDLRSHASRAPGNVMRFPAHPGDVALLLSHPVTDDITSTLGEGGPSAVDRIEAGGLVVEVR
jgi:hypothetical protein